MKYFFMISVISLSLYTFVLPGSFKVILSVQAVRGGLQGALLANFNEEVGFQEKIVDQLLTVDQLLHRVNASLEEYQRRSEPVILPLHELRKSILIGMLRQNPEIIRLLQRKKFLL